MGIRKDMMNLRKENDSPGPGAYDPDKIKVKKKEPQYRFGTDVKLRNINKNPIPDPASYNVKDDIMRKTASSWGMGYGSKIDLSKSLTETPGPGSYPFRTTIAEGKKYGMGLRKDMFKLDKDKSIPGPGAYSPDSIKVKSKAPEFGFGTANRLKEAGKQAIPDPQSYNIKDDITKKTSSSWGMGYGSKIDLAKTLADTPGPGYYNLKSTFTQVPGHESGE